MINTTYHKEWQENRLNFILSKYPKEFFKDKKILELGSHNGFFGASFQSFGADVLSVEGRRENIENILKSFPNLKVIQKDLDSPKWDFGKFDIIINFGLVYHFEKYHKEHLENCLNNCKLMFFESVIYDSKDSEIFFRNENGSDQSLTDIGGTPSTKYVEDIFKNNSKRFSKFSESSLNGGSHHYDWVDEDSKILNQYARRFWIVEN